MFLEEELAEAELEALGVKVALNLTAMTDGDNPCFFGDDNRHGVGFLAQAEGGAVAEAEVAVEVLPL